MTNILKLIFLTLITFNVNIFASETMIFIRHAEKPADGLGQLSCKGFNRSVVLPNVIVKIFGIPDYLFAPNPAIQKKDNGINYNYIRPLATIEPLAIKLSQNVDLSCGIEDVDCISKVLLENKYENKTLVVAWEHHKIEDIIKKIAEIKGLKLDKIPNWKNDDFDSMYVVKIDKNTIDLKIEQENLNNQNNSCNF
jgi:hypothetical protein